MKNNQFAQKSVNLDTVKQELGQVGFDPVEIENSKNVVDAFGKLLKKALVNSNDKSSQIEKLNNLLATPDQQLGNYLVNNGEINQQVFYLVALQLLQFQADVDFKINDPISAMKKINLAYISKTAKWNKNDLLKAWYLLLTTHTKNGQTYLDHLANQGFFKGISKEHPLFFNGKAQAIFEPNDLIYETVYVETDTDSDKDGNADLIKVEITRPKTSFKLGTLYTASPYDQGTNDDWGEQMTHNVDEPLARKEPDDTTYSDIQYQKQPQKFSTRKIMGFSDHATEHHTPKPGYTLNDYFLMRGYAVVYSAGIGTKDSDGIQTCGSHAQTDATVAVIEWINHKRRAFTNRTDNIEIKADWSNGNVAMTGRSYLGTLANAAATTGVDGLKTIISEAAISSWYDYYRENGLVMAPGGFQGEDADVLAAETFSRSLNLGDNLKIRPFFDRYLASMKNLMDRTTGNYNEFWDERNYHNDVSNIKADVLIVQGLNDWNVKPVNAAKLWQGIFHLPINKKIILHQGQHIYINAFRSFDFNDIVNMWISHELYDVDNDVMEQIPDMIVQDNVKPETWTKQKSWLDNSGKKYYLNQHGLTDTSETGQLTYHDQLDQAEFKQYRTSPQKWAKDLLDQNGPLKANQLLFKTPNLTEDQIISGFPKLHLRIATSKNVGLLSARLVDYGEANRLNVTPTTLVPKGLLLGHKWYTDDLREFTLNKHPTPSKMISFGHINLQNRHSSYQNDELVPHQFYDIDLTFQPTFYHLPAGRKLGLVLYGTDFQMTQRGNQKIDYTIDLENSYLQVPHK